MAVSNRTTKTVGIYKITSPSGKVYIGQSWDIARRFNDYKKNQCKGQRVLFFSFQKYGAVAHRFEVIHECPSNVEQSSLDRLEQFYMDSHRAQGFRLLNCKEAGSAGKMSDESRAKMSKSQTGRRHSEETKLKISLAHMGKIQKGTPLSEESKRKLSESKRGIPMSEAAKAKLSKFWTGKNIGRRMSDESRAKLSAAKIKQRHIYIGNTWGSANKGKKRGPHTAESRQKIAEKISLGTWLVFRDGALLGEFKSSMDAGKKLCMPPSTLRRIKNDQRTVRRGNNQGITIVVV